MSKHILAIEQGASSTKAVIFDERARILARGVTDIDIIRPQPGFVEQDPLAIYNSVISAVKKCVNLYQRSVRIELDDIKVCGIANQRETFILWDKSGTPLHNAILGPCKRSVEICEKIQTTKLADEIINRTGLVVAPYFSGTKIKWLVENDEDIQKAVDKGKVYGGTVDTWLLYKLTNGKSFYTDLTNASRTMFYNIHKMQWDTVLLRKLGLRDLNLPDVQTSVFNFGKSKFEDIFEKPVQIASMIGDSHAAAFGQTCFAAGDAKVSLGGGSSILLNTGDKPVASKKGLVTTISWSLPDRTDFALEGLIATAGATIQWLRNNVDMFTHPMETEQMATAVPDNGGVYFVPAFNGLGAPHWKTNSRAVISGLALESDKNHIIRAALESIPYQIKDVLTVMETEANVKLRELYADGGVTSNNFVMQFIADLLKVNVRSIAMDDVPALGAAYLAGLHAGIFDDLDSIKEINHQQRRFIPGDKRELAQVYYKGWQEAVKLIK